MENRVYHKNFAHRIHDRLKILRDQCPVFQAWFSRTRRCYLVSRYQDVANLLKDKRLVKNAENVRTKQGKKGGYWMPKAFRPLMSNMLNTDEPDHRRLRNLVHMAFTPKRIEEMRSRIEDVANELADNLAMALHQSKAVDVVHGFAMALPVRVISEMIGIPMDQRPLIESMTAQIMKGTSALNMLLSVPKILRFTKYVRRLAQQRVAAPCEDLMSALVAAETSGDRFSEDELVAMVFLLTVAGHETTVGLISNALLALLDFPLEKERLLQNPELMKTAVEEFLRFDGPLITTEVSYAREDIELQGTLIPQGAIVLPVILSANRDEREFENPDQLILDRHPNKHLAFGQGIHYCLGAPLARMETEIALRVFLSRFPRYHIDRNTMGRGHNFISNRPTRMNVSLGNGNVLEP